ncbi:hypothetical protein DJ017_03830 [Phenylobacterium soli]|uniref:HTH LytTR-type domain-containing protein n=1 Tax=Phenylobacterium soli TaxID=2170551 RepID=A0A328AR48_9CAUL|nr:hypothetical protein DJ017_03830 [Phenylobacterium soli]
MERPNPVSWRLVGRVLAVGTAIGLFLSLLGPFGNLKVWAAHAALNFAYSWIGSLLGLASARLSWRLGLWSRGTWAAGLATGILMAPPMCAVVWLGVTLSNGHPPANRYLPEILWDTVLICVGASLVAMLAARRMPAQPAPPRPVKFLDRIPLKLRGGELWAVQAEDHYLRLHTSKGQDLILMRLADAVAELDGIEGAQVHRSWWVARAAVSDARRGDGRATLTLKDGAEVPVSRTYAKALREMRWI